jgi:hypothetical protein
MPNLFGVGFPAPRETLEWLGRAYALLEESNSSDALSMKLACKMLLSQHARESEDAATEIAAILHRALAVAELRAPVEARGAFIPVGHAFAAFAAFGQVVGSSTNDVLMIDPYMRPAP